MKLFYVSSVPFTKQKEIDLYINELAPHYDIYKISFENIFNPGYPNNDSTDYLSFNDFIEFEKFIHQFNEKIILIITNTRLYQYFLNDFIKPHNLFFGVVLKSFLTRKISEDYTLKNRNTKLVTKLKTLFKRNKIIQFYLHNKKYSQRFDFIFSSFNPNKAMFKRLIKIHHPKYNQIITAGQNKIDIPKDFIVYIDSFIPHHPDFKYVLKQESINPENFYSKLNVFFDELETKYKIDVVIAADPKSNYLKNPFKRRLIIKYQTESLIKNSRFVISHASTSNYSAILFHKIIILLTSNEICEKIPSMHNSIMALSHKLHLKVYNLDNYNKNDFIDLENYDNHSKFIFKYLINSKYEDIPNSIIIKNYVNKL